MANLRSPTPRSEVSSPRPKFDAELLKAYITKLLSSTLSSSTWPDDRVKSWMKEIGDRVKARMLEIQPNGLRVLTIPHLPIYYPLIPANSSSKYIVLTQINENLGQGGRADMVCHWEDSDTVAQEVFVNVNVPTARCRSRADQDL
ncbi:hypothetical protein D9757_000175 [Collybiopsis confluens]|uniref:Uncharacterized protein n=1 Tax=Collybiopsis confluens TaxID=2823264 RepID=A0A8H5MH56_9AGAR|nr:hypothetical protein D9757_000175 [Collybiopsis confluens]